MNNNKILIITSFNKKLYEEYAHRFINTYNWPFDLKIYTETLFDIKKNYKVIQLNNDCKNFVERNKDRKNNGYIHDGVRFCYKVY